MFIEVIFLLLLCWGVVSVLQEITEWTGAQPVVTPDDTNSIFFLFSIVCFTFLCLRYDNCNCLHLLSLFLFLFLPFQTSDRWRNNLWWLDLGSLLYTDSCMNSLVFWFWRVTHTAKYQEIFAVVFIPSFSAELPIS